MEKSEKMLAKFDAKIKKVKQSVKPESTEHSEKSDKCSQAKLVSIGSIKRAVKFSPNKTPVETQESSKRESEESEKKRDLKAKSKTVA